MRHLFLLISMMVLASGIGYRVGVNKVTNAVQGQLDKLTKTMKEVSTPQSYWAKVAQDSSTELYAKGYKRGLIDGQKELAKEQVNNHSRVMGISDEARDKVLREIDDLSEESLQKLEAIKIPSLIQ